LTTRAIPQQAAIAIADLVDNCAKIEAGQHVVVVAARDGLHGGFNLVDESAIEWVQAVTASRGADVSVLWVNVPLKPTVLWGDGRDMGEPWRLPRVAKAAMKAADVIVSHVYDFSYEEELREMQDIVDEEGILFVRNMATTGALLTSNWALTPYELVSELRYHASGFGAPGDEWELTHPNGTHLTGTVAEPWDDRHFGGWKGYASYRSALSPYRPFPEGVMTPWQPANASGVAVVEEFGIIWARHIGLPTPLVTPVTIHVENNTITRFEGAREAEILREYYEYMSRYLGDAAYLFAAVHGGVHPSARVEPHQCPDALYRRFIEHHHWGSFHFHVGDHRHHEGMPYGTHVSAEFRGGEFRVGGKVLYGNDRLSVADHPDVQAVAAKYPGRPGLDPEAWARA
jgi:hypothetical protein